MGVASAIDKILGLDESPDADEKRRSAGLTDDDVRDMARSSGSLTQARRLYRDFGVSQSPHGNGNSEKKPV